jgi:hypothetical protein
MRKFILLFHLSVSTLCVAQDFSFFYPGVNLANLFVSIRTKDDLIYASAISWIDSTNFGFQIIKTDTFGNKINHISIYDTSLTFSTFSHYSGFEVTNDNKVLLYGNAGGGGQTMKNFLAIIDTDLKGYSIHFYDHISPLIQVTGTTQMLVTPTAYYLLGQEQTTDLGWTSNAFVIKTDLDGNELWRKSYGFTEIEEFAYSIILKASNEIVIAGSRTAPWLADLPGSEIWSNEWFLGIDTTGSILWEWTSPSETKHRSTITNLKFIDNAYVYVSADIWYGLWGAGWLGTNDFNKRDTNFNLIWRAKLPITTPNWNHSIWGAAIAPDSLSILGVGRPDQNSATSFHWKVNLEDGAEVFYRLDSACTTSYDIYECDLYGVAMLSSGSSVACGYVKLITPVGNATRGWLIKTNAYGINDLGDCMPVAIDEPQHTGKLITVYPNPANEVITLDLPEVINKYEVRIIDLSGRVLFSEIRGEEKPVLDVTQLPKGLYIVQVVNKQGVVLAVGKVAKVE